MLRECQKIIVRFVLDLQLLSLGNKWEQNTEQNNMSISESQTKQAPWPNMGTVSDNRGNCHLHIHTLILQVISIWLTSWQVGMGKTYNYLLGLANFLADLTSQGGGISQRFIHWGISWSGHYMELIRGCDDQSAKNLQ